MLIGGYIKNFVFGYFSRSGVVREVQDEFEALVNIQMKFIFTEI